MMFLKIINSKKGQISLIGFIIAIIGAVLFSYGIFLAIRKMPFQVYVLIGAICMILGKNMYKIFRR